MGLSLGLDNNLHFSLGQEALKGVLKLKENGISYVIGAD